MPGCPVGRGVSLWARGHPPIACWLGRSCLSDPDPALTLWDNKAASLEGCVETPPLPHTRIWLYATSLPPLYGQAGGGARSVGGSPLGHTALDWDPRDSEKGAVLSVELSCCFLFTICCLRIRGPGAGPPGMCVLLPLGPSLPEFLERPPGVLLAEKAARSPGGRAVHPSSLPR